MVTRRERVILELEDQLSSGMIRAAGATKALKVELENLSGTAVRTSRGSSGIGAVGDEAEKTGRKVEAAGRQIDRYSGRLALLAKTAAILGPALVPIGASAVPALAGLTTQLVAAAGAIGVAALAFTGLGDGLDALNEYQVEPTAENLQALRLELERLGPAGAHFVRFLDDLGPELQALQFAARQGLFPGVEDGITHLLDLLPQVQRIVFNIAEGMGELASDAGADLAGPQWRDFFDYLETDARPILDDLGRTIGNFAQGFAQMVVAFGPLSREFSGGLEDMSERFADWAAGLRDSEGFEGFVEYVRTAGPKVLDLLGAMADLFVGIVQAAAPVGDAVLPVLTGLLKVVTALVDSPLGPVFFTAAAAISLYSAAATVAEAATARLAKAQKGMMLLGGGKGMAATAGFVGLSIAVYDIVEAGEQAEAAIERLSDTIRSMDSSQIRRARDEMQALIDAQHPDDGSLSNYWDAVKGSFNDLTGRTARMRQEVAAANDALRNGGGLADLFAQGIGRSAAEMEAASRAAQDFSGALAELNGWLDKRQALRDYRASLVDLGEGLRESFGPGTVERIDTVARNLARVASQIKNKDARADFLAGARRSLLDLADNAGPKGEAAVRRVIRRLDELGLTHPKPKVDVEDDAANNKIDRTERNLNELDRKNPRPKVDVQDRDALGSFRGLLKAGSDVGGMRPKPRVDAETDQARGALNTVIGLLNAADRDVTSTVTTYVKTVRSVTDFVYGTGSADGGTVPKTGWAYADRHPYLLADGEEVISNRYGQADRHRDLLKAINAGRLADGGTAGVGTAVSRAAGRDRRSPEERLELLRLQESIRDLTRSLNADGKKRLQGLERRIAVAELQQARQDLRAARRSSRTATREAFGEFELDGGMTRDDIRSEYAEFRRVLREAGVDLPRGFDRIRDNSLRLADRFEDVTGRLEDSRDALEAWRATAEEVARSVGGFFDNNIYGGGLSAAMTQLEADRNDTAERDRLLRGIAGLGVDTRSDAFKSLATGGDMATLRDLDTTAEARAFQAMFAARASAQSQAGQWAADAFTGQHIAKLERVIDRQESTLSRLNQQLERQEQRLEAATMRGAREGSERGTQRGTERALRDQQRVQTAKAQSR